MAREQQSWEVHYSPEEVLKEISEECDFLAVVGIDSEGNIIVSGTHGTPLTLHLLQEGIKFINSETEEA